MSLVIARFEAVGDLYRRDTGCLRPGMSEPVETGRDSSSEENRARFEQWFATQAFTSGVDWIIHLESELREREDDED